MSIKIAIFASGSGTNAEAIMRHFRSHPDISVELVISNNPHAFVLERAKKFDVPVRLVTRAELGADEFMNFLLDKGITHIVLAGFLLLMPASLVRRYAGKIINIHPALLPRFGGKGMYGENVHKAVIAAGDPESGISIHEVNEQYDEGRIVFQARCRVEPDDDFNSIAEKIHELEHRYYPIVIEQWAQQKPVIEM